MYTTTQVCACLPQASARMLTLFRNHGTLEVRSHPILHWEAHSALTRHPCAAAQPAHKPRDTKGACLLNPTPECAHMHICKTASPDGPPSPPCTPVPRGRTMRVRQRRWRKKAAWCRLKWTLYRCKIWPGVTQHVPFVFCVLKPPCMLMSCS